MLKYQKMECALNELAKKQCKTFKVADDLFKDLDNCIFMDKKN